MSLDKTSDYYYRVLEAINEFTSTETGSRLPTLDLILKTETNGNSAKAAALGILYELLILRPPLSETPQSAEDQLPSARHERLLRRYAKIIEQLATRPLPSIEDTVLNCPVDDFVSTYLVDLRGLRKAVEQLKSCLPTEDS